MVPFNRKEGWKFGYHVKASKSHIIVKEKYQDKAKQKFQGSKINQLTNSIKQQEHRYTVSDENIKNCSSSIKKKRKEKRLNILTSLGEQMSSKNKRLNDIDQERGSSGMQSIYDMGFH